MSLIPLWKKMRRHVRPLILMLVILLVLVIPELENAWISDPCALQESEQSFLTTHLYGHLSNWAFYFHKNLGPPVTIVYIDPKTDPEQLLTNTCLARDFVAQLVNDITRLGAQAIVIDKFYSEGSCSDQTTNEKFSASLNDSATKTPIVVGRPTHLLANVDKAKGGCLALSDQFNFGPLSQVKYGLTRLNSDVLRIPLRWPIFQESSDPNVAPKQRDVTTGDGDSLSLVAAIQIDPRISRIRALGKHPYTNFLELPSTTAMAVRCYAEQTPLDANGKALDCTKVRNPTDGAASQKIDLNGKVVVIGDLSDQDMQPFPDSHKERPGVYLQANYVKSILDQRILREIPLSVTLTGLVLFIIAVYCLHWFITPTRALLVSFLALLSIVVVSLFALLAFKYYTPLWAFSSAAAFVIFRYLETRAHHYSTEVAQENSHPKN